MRYPTHALHIRLSLEYSWCSHMIVAGLLALSTLISCSLTRSDSSFLQQVLRHQSGWYFLRHLKKSLRLLNVTYALRTLNSLLPIFSALLLPQKFSNFSVLKLGFMDHFTGDAFMAMEASVFPTLQLFDPLKLQCGFVASSRTSHFNDSFALDMLPTVILKLLGGATAHLMVITGLAGQRREDTLLNLVFNIPL